MIPSVPEMAIVVEPLGRDGSDRWVLSAGPSFGVAFVRFVFLQGAAADGELAGATNASMELLQRGTRDKTRTEWNLAMDALGGRWSISTQRDRTVISLICLEAFLDEALDLLVELLTEPRDDPDELSRALQQIETRVEAELEEPDGAAARALSVAVYPGTPWERPLEGYRDDRRSIDVAACKDRRHDLLSAPALVGIAAEEPEALQPAVAAAWERIRAAWPHAEEASAPERPLPRAGVLAAVSMAGSPQGSIFAIGRGPDPCSDRWPGAVAANACFGFGFVSPLMKRIRAQEGLSYSVSADLIGTRGSSLWLASAQPESPLVPYTLRAMREVWDEYAAAPIAPDYLERIKASMVGDHLLRLETARHRLIAAMEMERTGRAVESLWLVPRTIVELTTAQVETARGDFGWGLDAGSAVAALDLGADEPAWIDEGLGAPTLELSVSDLL